MGDVAGPSRRLTGADLDFLAEAANPCPAAGHEQVLDDAGAVGGRAVKAAGLEPQPVDLHRLPPAGTETGTRTGTKTGTKTGTGIGSAVVAHVEQSRLDAGGGDPHARAVRDQGRERNAERAREGVQRAQRRVADTVLDFRERPLADVRRLRERTEGQAAPLPRRAQPLADQPGQIVHDE